MGDADAFFAKLAPKMTSDGTSRNRLTLTNDLLNLPSLTVPSMLEALEHRFKKQVVYALTGDVRTALCVRSTQACRLRLAAS